MSIPVLSPQGVIPYQLDRRTVLKGGTLRAGRRFFLTFAAMLALHLSLHGQEKQDPPKHFTNSIGMKFVWVPPGSFVMGSPKSRSSN